jgi:hypothetical protein
LASAPAVTARIAWSMRDPGGMRIEQAFERGPYKDVSRACTRKVRALARGATFGEIVESWVDVDEAPGLLLLEGPSKADGRTPHFRCFALSYAAVCVSRSPERDTLRARWLDLSLPSAWGFLGLFGQYGRHFALTDARLLDFLERAVAYWPELQAVGARYSYAPLCGAEPLERIHTSINFALARQGVPGDQVRSMSPDGPAHLLAESPGRRVRDFLARGEVERATSELRRIDAEVFPSGKSEKPTDDRSRTTAAIVLCALGAHFMTAGHGEEAAAIIREIAQRGDPHGLLFEWLSEYATTHVDAASEEDVVRAYLERGGAPNWERLVQFGPDDAPIRVVEEQRRRADWQGLMMTLIHHTRDFDAALRLWDEHSATEPGIRWAAGKLADGIASRSPGRAAELYVLAAEQPLSLGKRYVSRESASVIAKACAVLGAAGMQDRGRELVERFRQKHRKRRLLLEAMAEQGL